MQTLKTAINEVTAEVYGGKCIAHGVADGGYEIRVQRADTWNSRTPRFVVHVWHREEGAKKSRLLKKAEWLPMVA
jgi:hypothetical protein